MASMPAKMPVTIELPNSGIINGSRFQARCRGLACAIYPAIVLLHQARTSKIKLNGVSVARLKRLKPASVATWRSLRSPAWAPSPRPTS